MNVNKINNISFRQNYAENPNAKISNDGKEYHQINTVVSKDAAYALRNIALGLMVLGASVGANSCLSSCTETLPEYKHDSGLHDNWIITDNGDTIAIDKAKAFDNFLNMQVR